MFFQFRNDPDDRYPILHAVLSVFFAKMLTEWLFLRSMCHLNANQKLKTSFFVALFPVLLTKMKKTFDPVSNRTINTLKLTKPDYTSGF